MSGPSGIGPEVAAVGAKFGGAIPTRFAGDVALLETLRSLLKSAINVQGRGDWSESLTVKLIGLPENPVSMRLKNTGFMLSLACSSCVPIPRSRVWAL